MTKKSKQLKHLKKEIKQHCHNCGTIYQLLEIHTKSLPTDTLPIFKEKCLNDCLEKWVKTLHEHYNKEIVNYLNEQENEKGDE